MLPGNTTVQRQGKRHMSPKSAGNIHTCHVHHMTIDTPLTWVAFDSAVAKIHHHVAQAQNDVFLVVIIADQVNPLPMGGWRDPLYRAYTSRPINLRRWVIVGASPTLRVTLHLFMQLYGLLGNPPIRFVPTVNDAYHLIRRQSATSK